jgi:hypothetical protein
MPIVPVVIRISDRDYQYTPLLLTPARLLWDTVVKKYGGCIAALLEGVRKPENLSAESEVADFMTEGISMLGSGIREFVYNHDNATHTMLWNTLRPHIEMRNDIGNFIPLSNELAEDIFATNVSGELCLLIECLKVQYKDFLSLWANASTTIGQIKNAIKNLPFQKD